MLEYASCSVMAEDVASWSQNLTCALPVFVISKQASERAHRKDIHTHLPKEPMPNSALTHRGHFLNYSLVTYFPVRTRTPTPKL